MQIRDFDSNIDQPELRRLVVVLQDFERGLDFRMPAGDAIADRYVELMLRRCAEHDGSILIAEVEGAVAGFATVWARYRSSEPDDDPSPHGFVSDLVVDPDHRGRGIGRGLLRAAESRARRAGVEYIRLSVKAGNEAALGLYADEGFSESVLFLEKSLV